MSDRIPEWWTFLLLALLAYRLWRIVGFNTISDGLRHRLQVTLARRWGTERAAYWIDMVECPWCAGFWIGLAVWGSWLIAPDWTVVLAVPFAVNAVVGNVAKLDTKID